MRYGPAGRQIPGSALPERAFRFDLYTRDQFTPYASVQSPSGPLPSPETPARCAIREEIDSSHRGEYAEENAGMGDPETGKTKGEDVKFGSDVKSEQKFLVNNTET